MVLAKIFDIFNDINSLRNRAVLTFKFTRTREHSNNRSMILIDKSVTIVQYVLLGLLTISIIQMTIYF